MMRKISLCSAFGVALGTGLKTWRSIRETAPYCTPGDSIEFTATILMHDVQGKSCWENVREGMK